MREQTDHKSQLEIFFSNKCVNNKTQKELKPIRVRYAPMNKQRIFWKNPK